MRMTDEEVRETVAGARMTDQEKAALLRQALGGDASARFVVHALRARQRKEGGR